MEEDIKRMEYFINQLDEYYNADIEEEDIIQALQETQIGEAIRNLIARYKELEKENANLRDTNKTLYEMGQRQAMQILIEEEYIPKSKIQKR